MKQSSLTSLTSLLLGAFAAGVSGSAVVLPTNNLTATIDLSKTRGALEYRGAGFIYGIPDTPNQIQDHWYENMKFQYGRPAVAQLGALLAQIAGNWTVPDQYAYHLEGITTPIDNDLQTTNVTVEALLDTYGLPERQINIDEYANWEEQVPAGAAWWLSRLERYDVWGLRGNWESGTAIYDLFANLLTKSYDAFIYAATDYVAAPEYPIHTYYALNMTGLRATTTDATIGHEKVRIIAGVRLTTGNYSIEVSNLEAVHLPQQGRVN